MKMQCRTYVDPSNGIWVKCKSKAQIDRLLALQNFKADMPLFGFEIVRRNDREVRLTPVKPKTTEQIEYYVKGRIEASNEFGEGRG